MLFIARRYLLSKKSHSVVNIIAVVSLFSLMLPVAAVIILLSIFNGFGAMVSTMDHAMEGDLTLSLKEGKLFEASELDSAELRRIKGVEALSYTTEAMLLAEYGGQNRLLSFRGVESDYCATLPIEDHVYVGRFETQLGDLDRVVIGNSVATSLGIRSLSNIDITLYALKTGRLQSYIPMGRHETRSLRLSGVVLLDESSEERYGYSSRRAINELLGREDALSRVIFKVREGADIERVKATIKSLVGDRFKVETRLELNPALYQIIHSERMGIMMICLLVMILASFSLLGALAMLIIEKRGEMETLRSMGATRSDVRRIFVIEGVLLSSVAIGLGAVLGVVLTLVQAHYGIIEMPMASAITSIYPVDLEWLDVVYVVAMAMIISQVVVRSVVMMMLRSFEKK